MSTVLFITCQGEGASSFFERNVFNITVEWKFHHCMMRKDENVDAVGTSKISAQVRLQHTDVFECN